MKKEEVVLRYGEDEYERRLAQHRDWLAKNYVKHQEQRRTFRQHNPKRIIENNRQHTRKGGKYYKKEQIYKQTGLQGERNVIRKRHGCRWQKYKRIIAPDSQCHHEWVPKTAEYRGVALVEKDAHQYGRIDVIQILEGEITLLTEKEIREQK